MSVTRIYDQFTTIAADVATKTGMTVNYLYGHPIEIIEILQQMSQNPTQQAGKYPLVALFTDYPETRGVDPGIDATVRLHLIVATLTLPGYTAPERAAANFEPVLYPIYEQLLKSIVNSGYYMNASPERLRHTKTDRFYWGKNGLYLNTGNVFDDYIDCIEIENLELTVLKQC